MASLEIAFLEPLASRAADERQPLVSARVDGRTTLLLVDTGATETLLTRDFVSSLGLPLAAVAPGTDHGGNPVPTWTSAAPVSLALGMFETRLDSVPVVAAPRRFARLGIGGILCPQQLDPMAMLSLDFAAGVMTVGAARPDEAGRIATAYPVVRLVGDEARLIVAGSEAGAILFNSGTWRSEVAVGHVGDPPLSRSGFGLGGAAVRSAALGPHAISIGALRLPPVFWLAAPQPDGVDLQFGMELLGSTRLDFDPAGGAVRWWTPASWFTPS